MHLTFVLGKRSFYFICLFVYLFKFFGCTAGMRDLSSPTRDQTRSGSAECQPLVRQGIPCFYFKFKYGACCLGSLGNFHFWSSLENTGGEDTAEESRLERRSGGGGRQQGLVPQESGGPKGGRPCPCAGVCDAAQTSGRPLGYPERWGRARTDSRLQPAARVLVLYLPGQSSKWIGGTDILRDHQGGPLKRD